jgi:acetyltransferase-like isoleucine patch superfamily enzyme
MFRMNLKNLRLTLKALIDPFFYFDLVRVAMNSLLIDALRMYRFNDKIRRRFPQLINRTDLIIERPNDCQIEPSVYFGKDVRLVFSMLSEVGKDRMIIKNNVYICERVELGVERNSILTIGANTFIRENSRLLGNVTVGDYCQISQNVYIAAGSHIFDSEPWLYIRDQDAKYFKKNENTFVEIHDDVFIGANVFIKSNIIVGKGAVIGANAAVLGDVLPYSIIGSNGLKIRDRFHFIPPRFINYLVDQHLPYFYSGIACDTTNITIARNMGGLKFISNSAILVMNLSDCSTFRLLLRISQSSFLIPDIIIKVNGIKQNEIIVEHNEKSVLIKIKLKVQNISIKDKFFQRWDRIDISLNSFAALMVVEAEAIQV